MSEQILCIQLGCLTKAVVHGKSGRYDSSLGFFNSFLSPSNDM
jgi:hypothetical protein